MVLVFIFLPLSQFLKSIFVIKKPSYSGGRSLNYYFILGKIIFTLNISSSIHTSHNQCTSNRNKSRSSHNTHTLPNNHNLRMDRRSNIQLSPQLQ